MKKRGTYITIFIAFVLLLAFAAGCRSTADIRTDERYERDIEITKIPDGDYRGEATDGPVKAVVIVEVKNGKIRSIVLEHHRMMKGKPAERIPQDVIRAQSLNVDTVSGATISSRAILAAIADALSRHD
ncbi:MAG: FMN-binding protein [Spirochaetes bacterium]|nr:FMN-binding protein [Spirochaetota bacterium]